MREITLNIPDAIYNYIVGEVDKLKKEGVNVSESDLFAAVITAVFALSCQKEDLSKDEECKTLVSSVYNILNGV